MDLMDYRLLEVDFFSRNYDPIKYLGAGAFGVTYRCVNKLDRKEYAVKVIPCTKEDTKNAVRECKAMSTFHQENIVHYHTAWMEAGVPSFAVGFVQKNIGFNPKKEKIPVRTVYIVMDYYPRTLETEMEKGVLTDAAIQKIFFGLANGLNTIHMKGWVHRDLHPGNIFLDESGNPRIGDFGLSKKIGEIEEGVRFGNGLYQAPEVFARRQYTPGADMWSFSLLMLELVCGLRLDEKVATFNHATAGEFPERFVQRYDQISLTVQQIINAARPNDRMKASDILEHM